jgi:hypothetical protein
MEASGSSETSVNFYKANRRHNPEYSNLYPYLMATVGFTPGADERVCTGIKFTVA